MESGRREAWSMGEAEAAVVAMRRAPSGSTRPSALRWSRPREAVTVPILERRMSWNSRLRPYLLPERPRALSGGCSDPDSLRFGDIITEKQLTAMQTESNLLN